MAAQKANPTPTTGDSTNNVPTKVDRIKRAIHPLRNITPLRMNMILNGVCIGRFYSTGVGLFISRT